MMQIRFSKPRLIKISMIYLYIKAEVKKIDTIAMTIAINEACVGEGDFSGAGFFWMGFFPHLQGFPKW